FQTAQWNGPRPEQVAAREDQLLAQIDQRQLTSVGEHGFDGERGERACCDLTCHGVLKTKWPARRPAMTLQYFPRLRRLLRRHLLHRAGLQVDADAVDLVEIDAGDAHEARFVRRVDRVNLAVLVDAGVAGFEP